jgi:hypothetical protein
MTWPCQPLIDYISQSCQAVGLAEEKFVAQNLTNLACLTGDFDSKTGRREIVGLISIHEKQISLNGILSIYIYIYIYMITFTCPNQASRMHVQFL